MKYRLKIKKPKRRKSPLAEGRELKSNSLRRFGFPRPSPLAEGRELKYEGAKFRVIGVRRPSRRGVN